MAYKHTSSNESPTMSMIENDTSGEEASVMKVEEMSLTDDDCYCTSLGEAPVMQEEGMSLIKEVSLTAESVMESAVGAGKTASYFFVVLAESVNDYRPPLSPKRKLQKEQTPVVTPPQKPHKQLRLTTVPPRKPLKRRLMMQAPAASVEINYNDSSQLTIICRSDTSVPHKKGSIESLDMFPFLKCHY